MRIKVISVVFSLLFGLLIIYAGYTQILRNKKYSNLSYVNRVRLMPIESQRGRIFDRNGVLVVGNRPSYNVFVIPQELENSARTLSRVGEFFDISPKEMFAMVEREYRAPFIPVLIKEDIGKRKAIQLQEETVSLPGVMVEASPQREYYFQDTACHILGHVGAIDERELKRLKGYGYQIKDRIGKSGLEKSYDSYLRGEHGGMQLEVNNKGYLIKSLGKKTALSGKSLFLTIDIELQRFAERFFSDRDGACIIMDPRNGEILALVSSPGFDPNIFVNKSGQGVIKKLLRRKDYPMLNRAISCLYPPGSVFKPVVAIAALEKHRIRVNDRFVCKGEYLLGGNTFRCWDEDGHGSQDVHEGLKNSCNCFFYQAGRLVGVDDIATFATKFGYGMPTGIDLPGEATGLVPNRLWKRIKKRQTWFEGDTVNFAIGQGYLLVTPMQVARMIAAIANGGNLVEPYIVKRIEGVEIAAVRSRYAGISKETLAVIKDGLRKVVEDEWGTGARASVKGLRIAGKTGTAENPIGVSHAWFSGFSPIDQPLLTVTVFIEHGGKGGAGASELAGTIFNEAHKRGLL